MRFDRLVQAVESNSDEIVTSLVNQVRRDPECKDLHALSDPELRQWASALATGLGSWLASQDKVAGTYSELGKVRFQQHVPLHQCVREILLLKNIVVNYVRQHSFANTAVDLHAEEELEHLLQGCFDRVLYHFVRGYEGSRVTE